MPTEYSNTVQVTIYGHTYTIRSKADPGYINSIAGYVDAKMREVMDKAPPTASELRVAILAAMNIADELFSLRRNREREESYLEERVQALSDLIDETLST